MEVYIYALDGNYRDVSIDKFYIPAEVNGEPGIDMITGEKIDAYKALDEFRSDEEINLENDPNGLIFSPMAKQNKIPPIPVLLSEGFRDVFSVDTVQNN